MNLHGLNYFNFKISQLCLSLLPHNLDKYLSSDASHISRTDSYQLEKQDDRSTSVSCQMFCLLTFKNGCIMIRSNVLCSDIIFIFTSNKLNLKVNIKIVFFLIFRNMI